MPRKTNDRGQIAGDELAFLRSCLEATLKMHRELGLWPTDGERPREWDGRYVSADDISVTARYLARVSRKKPDMEDDLL